MYKLLNVGKFRPFLLYVGWEDRSRITRNEILQTIKKQKNNKAPDSDQIEAKRLNVMADRDANGITKVTKLLNRIKYSFVTGYFSQSSFKGPYSSTDSQSRWEEQATEEEE